MCILVINNTSVKRWLISKGATSKRFLLFYQFLNSCPPTIYLNKNILNQYIKNNYHVMSDENNNNQNQPIIAIIGGGFSGSLVTVNLARIATKPITIKLINKSQEIGRGLAYNTSVLGHLLNVPAGKISALPLQPKHFLDWLHNQGYSHIESTDFVPREIYGDYIQSTLQEVKNNPNVTLEIITADEAIAIEKNADSTQILLKSGRNLTADRVILALGNPPPSILPILKDYQEDIKNPWQIESINNLNSEDSILLIGTGLTMVDVAISLQEKGFKGQIYAISRHGLKPLAHQSAPPYPLFINLKNAPQTIRNLLHLVRTEIKLAQSQNINWRAVIDALRIITQELWQNLPLKEQQRFLRHLKAYWEVHRHRIAKEIAEKLNILINSDQLKFYKGRINKCVKVKDKFAVIFKERGTQKERSLLVNLIFNCTGSSGNYQDQPLIISLQKQNLIKIHPLFLGFETAQNGLIIDSYGNISNWLYTLGPPRKGDLWETTAVPEIRVQAFNLAQEIWQSFNIFQQ